MTIYVYLQYILFFKGTFWQWYPSDVKICMSSFMGSEIWMIEYWGIDWIHELWNEIHTVWKSTCTCMCGNEKCSYIKIFYLFQDWRCLKVGLFTTFLNQFKLIYMYLRDRVYMNLPYITNKRGLCKIQQS